MRARAVSLLASLAVLGAFASPSDAAADPRLVLSGSGYRYIDVTLRRETVLDFFNFLGDHKAMTASYRGDFAGFAVETGDARHRVIGGAVLVRGRVTRTAGGWPDPVGLTDDTSLTLRPGRYRFVLIADGPAEVRVRVRRGLTRDLRVAARGVARGVSARRYDLGEVVPGGPGAVSMTRAPFTLTPKGLVVGSFYSSPGDSAPAYVSLCVREDAGLQPPCDEAWIFDPGTSVTTAISDQRRGSASRTGSFVYEFTELIAGPDVGDGNGFVVSFADAD